MKSTHREQLLPNGAHGEHRWRGVELSGKTIDIGKADVHDTFVDCRLVDCHLRIVRVGGGDLAGCTMDACTIEAKRALKNVRFTDMTLRACRFLGSYVGCRFGNENDTDRHGLALCDFSSAKEFDACDFLIGVDVPSLTLPAWPHITVTGLPEQRGRWLALDLPRELHAVQRLLGEDDAPWQAVSLYLPDRYAGYEVLRSLLEAQGYVHVSAPR